MKRFGFGQSRLRVEDQRFVTGHGTYTDDINLTGQSYGWVVRSLLPHADVTVDAGAARDMPGIRLVLTASEMAAQGVGAMVCGFMPEGAKPPRPRPVIADQRTRHAGEALAFVVADSLVQARDAAEAVL
ncbi:MAG: xanthine dehydrogenase family protein molybdopterin-binding subunit, partial [Magnetospirillum sp.]|nr:xanthine dehydrogenase family protein molybdopterin-binding subunit [Magnetospirillum sp.]